MTRSLTLLLALLLAGCSTPAPTVADAADDPSLSGIATRVKSRASAPTTRASSAQAGSLFGSSTSTSRGRPETVSSQRMTLRLESGRLPLDLTMITPADIRTLPQRYSNDCAQSAIATTLNFFGVEADAGDLYDAVAGAMAPMAWGTRLEDVQSYLDSVSVLHASPVRLATLDTLRALIHQGKPVPVVLSLGDTTMHYVVVIGTGVSQAGQDVVVFKDPSRPDPTDMGVLDAETFEAAWENHPIRESWWNFLAQTFTSTNTANYERIAFDIGLK